MVTQVIDQTPRVQFTAAAAQTIFAYPFLIFVKTDITVDVNGTTLVVDVGFTVSDVGNINGGNVTLTAGSTAGDIVTIFRSQGFDRETDYQESGDFLSGTVNDDMNRMILMDQQNREELSRTLQYAVDDIVGTNSLPLFDVRKNTLLGFNNDGNPVPLLAVPIASNTTVVDSISAMKLLIPSDNDDVFATGYFAASDGGGGWYTFDLASSANDNGGTVIAPNVGVGRWLLASTGIVSAKQFGVAADGTTDDVLTIQAALDSGVDSIFFPSGTYKITDKLTISAEIILLGESGTIIEKSTAGNAIEFAAGILQIRIYNIEIHITLAGSTCVLLKGGNSKFYFENVKFFQTFGVEATGDACIKFDVGTTVGTNYGMFVHCDFTNSHFSVFLPVIIASGVEINEITFHGCRFDRSAYGVNVVSNGSGGAFKHNGWRFVSCSFENHANLSIYHDQVGWVISGCRFEDVVTPSWDTFPGTDPGSTSTNHNPIIFGANSEKNDVNGCHFIPQQNGKIYKSYGIRSTFLHGQEGSIAPNLSIVGSQTHSSHAVGAVTRKQFSITSQTADIEQTFEGDPESGGTQTEGVTKDGIRYSIYPTATTPSGTTITIDASLSNFQRTFILTAEQPINTITISNGKTGQWLTIRFVWQSATPSAPTWSNALIAGAVSWTGSDKKDVITLQFDGTDWLERSRALNLA